MVIDLGDNPIGTPPTAYEKQHIRNSIDLGNVEDVALSTWVGSETLRLSSGQIIGLSANNVAFLSTATLSSNNVQKAIEEVNYKIINQAPFNAGNIGGTVTLAVSSGLFQKANITNNLTLSSPIGGTEGKTLYLWLSSTSSYTLNFSSIRIPSDSGIILPKTLNSGELYIIKFQYSGSFWMLISLVGGY